MKNFTCLKMHRRQNIVLMMATLLVVITACFTFLCEEAYADDTVASGSCGSNATYKLIEKETGKYTLRIDGSGKMSDYFIKTDPNEVYSGTPSNPPWYNYRTGIDEIVISDEITSIGWCSFFGCTSVTNVVLPEKAAQIGLKAFYNCKGLTTITLRNNIKTIQGSAFYGCSNCQEIDISSLDKWCSIVFSGSTSNPLCYSGKLYLNGDAITGKMIIPEGTSKIGAYTFYCCGGLTGVTIPDGVTSIATYAFYGCKELETIYIPSSVKSISDNSVPNTATIITYPNTAADQYAKENGNPVYYIENGSINDEIAFTTECITMSPLATLTLDSYIATNIDLSECTVKLSSNDSFAYDEGKIVNLEAGECTITVSYGDSSATAKIIAVDNVPDIEAVSFGQDTITIAKGSKSANTVSVSPEAACVDSLDWNSSDESVAKVDKGIVTAISLGEATITAKSTAGDPVMSSYKVIVNQPLLDLVVLDISDMEVGNTAPVEFYQIPSNTTDEISFSTSSDNIEIDDNGVVTAVKPGKAQVTVSGGDVSKTITINVTRKPDSISLNKSTVRVEATKTAQLEVIYDPEDTTERDVIWTSSKESVATVDENGLVTAHGKGISTITATVGTLKAECSVVCPEVSLEEISIDESHNMHIGDKTTLEVSYVPETTTDDKTVKWSSSNTKVATVSDGGEVTAVAAGSAIITATVGSCSATCSITIEKYYPEYDIPDNLQGYCKQQLSEIKLPDGFAWEDPDEVIGTEGTSTYDASYTPDDTEIYNTIHNIKVPITIKHCEWSSDESGHWKDCACGLNETKSGHTFGEWETTKEATDTAAGEKKHVCTVCGYEETAAIDAIYISISNESQLSAVRNKPAAHYRLEEDIELTSSTWSPIATFSGVFDGNGHTISGLNIKSEDAGLFAKNTGTIRRLTVEGKVSCNTSKVAGIVASNSGTIDSCVNKCSVTATGPNASYSGGVTAYNSGTVTNCKNYGDIQTWGIKLDSMTSGPIAYAGGLAGYAKGSVSGENYGQIIAITAESYSYSGGITGFSEKGSIVNASANEGEVQASVTGNKSTYAAFAGGISGKSKAAISKSKNAGTILALGGNGSSNAGGIAGAIDGCNIRECSNNGLVNGTNQGGTSTITTAGGIVGMVSNGTNCVIDNSINEGKVTSTSYGNSIAGGIAGSNDAKINYCMNSGQTAADRRGSGIALVLSGGIAGQLKTEGVIAASANTGTVYTNGVSSDVGYAGGISGISDETTSVSESYNTGTIIGYYTAGGIVGKNDGTISDCYSINDFEANSTRYLGGIIGYCGDTGSVSNVYASISYTGTFNNKGLLVGNNQGSSNGSLVANNNKGLDTVGSGSSVGTVLCIKAMSQKDPYGQFDFSSVWSMGSGGYRLPVLKNCAGKNGQADIEVDDSCVYSDPETIVEPTCTEYGRRESVCEFCGDVLEETIAPEHKWNTEYTIETAATYTAAGSKSIHCSVCGAIKPDSEVAIPKLTPHDILDLPTVKITKPKVAKKSATVKWKKVSKKNLKKVKKIQIQYSLDKSFKSGVKTKYANAKKTSLKIKGLKSKKKYYVRIRAYSKTGGRVHASKWSSVKSMKAK